MLENKWDNIAPEVPQDFHDKFEETLRQIEQADPVDKKYKRKRISGRLLIAVAVICRHGSNGSRKRIFQME